jgi:hypothetical protein
MLQKCAVVSGILSFYVTMKHNVCASHIGRHAASMVYAPRYSRAPRRFIIDPGSLLALKYKKTFRAMVGKAS